MGGNDRPAMITDDILRRLALERALRERATRQRTEAAPFNEWLVQAAPMLEWHWPHLSYLSHYLNRVSKREIRRMMMFMPPRHAKSTTTSIYYPTYELERDPNERIVVATYGSTLAMKFSRRTRALVRARAKVELDPERQAVEDWLTRAGGGLRAVGVGGGITGQGFDLLLIDDPVKGREEAESETMRERVWDWFTDDLWTRQEPNAAVILLMTRWHHDDLAGRILENLQDYGGDNEWVVLNLPALCEGNDPPDYPVKREVGEALWPERFDEKTLLEYEKVMGRSFYSLYQQRPAPESGDVFDIGWFAQRTGAFPQGKRTQVWDTAQDTKDTNDFSALVEGLKGEDGNYYVAAFENSRLAFPDLARSVRNHQARSTHSSYGVELCIENKANGKPIRQELRTLGIPVIEIDPGTNDKVVRAKSITHYCEGGLVVLVDAPGNINDQLVNQLVTFPHGRYDDLVDAFVHLMRRLTGGARRWTEDDFRKFMPKGTLATYREGAAW